MKVVQVLLLLFIVETSHTYENVALRGRATQSSRSDSPFSAAYNAIDGNPASDFKLGSCSRTATQDSPWWGLDLLETYSISSITVVKNDDSLVGAEIHAGNSTHNHGLDNPVVATITNDNSVEVFPFLSPLPEGRYVTVALPGSNKHLTLCEVEIHGYHAPTEENLAIYGKASQSSVFDHRTANLAIDGSRNTSSDLCMHTEHEFNPWLRLDLGNRHKVFSVKVTNRVHDYERLNGAVIHIGDSLEHDGNDNPVCAKDLHILPGETMSFACNGTNGMDGQYVTLVIPREEFLHVCEVEVYGSVLH